MSPWAGRRVLVTGGSGFLGTHLVRALAERGARVTSMSRHGGGTPPNASAVVADVAHSGQVEETMERVRPEVVFHLAARSLAGDAERDPVETERVNVGGTRHVLGALRRVDPGGILVILSSDRVYADGDPPFDEASPVRGAHPYDASKLAAEALCREAHRQHGTAARIARASNLFGPGDEEDSRIVPGTIRSALAGERPVIRSDGTPRRDFLFVGDAVEGLLALGAAPRHAELDGAALNLGSGSPLSILELTRRVLDACGACGACGGEGLEPEVRDEVPGPATHRWLDASRARRLLGWRAATGVDEGLRVTVDWHAQRLSRERTTRG